MALSPPFLFASPTYQKVFRLLLLLSVSPLIGHLLSAVHKGRPILTTMAMVFGEKARSVQHNRGGLTAPTVALGTPVAGGGRRNNFFAKLPNTGT